jgi:protein involved in polysaccharide export with SLBB domain
MKGTRCWRRDIRLLLQFLLAVACSIIVTGISPTSGATADIPSQASNSVEDVYFLDVGDKLRLIVFGEADLGGEFVVDGSGNVRLPLIGEVRAAGLPLPEFENSVKQALEKGYLKQARVSAEVIGYRPFYILGQVNKPGEYGFVNGMNVLTAIALAGGYTHRASESNVFIRRKGSSEERAAPADQTTRVMPGDIIRVRERFF